MIAWAYVTFLLCGACFIAGLAYAQRPDGRAASRAASADRTRELSLYYGKLERVLERVETRAADWQAMGHPVEVACGEQLEQLLDEARRDASRESADDDGVPS